MFRKLFRVEIAALYGKDLRPSLAERLPRTLLCGHDVWRPFIGARLPPVI